MIMHLAKAKEKNGLIIALDQEKAYDKISHDYLWNTLEAFNTVWLKHYLSSDEERPHWEKIADQIFAHYAQANAPKDPTLRIKPFLQTWRPATTAGSDLPEEADLGDRRTNAPTGTSRTGPSANSSDGRILL
jgi:hypothetical protein